MKMPEFLAFGGGEFNPGPVMRLDPSELLYNKVLLKYKRDRENFWHRHQKGAERVPLWQSLDGCYINYSVQFSSVAQLCPILWPHESQHARPPCPSPTARVHPNSCASSRWCHPTISSSVIPFSSCPQPLQHQSLFQWVNSSHEVP